MQSKKKNDLLMRLPHAACRVFFFFPLIERPPANVCCPPPPKPHTRTSSSLVPLSPARVPGGLPPSDSSFPSSACADRLQHNLIR